MTTAQTDVLVVGGGIHGVAVAQAVAAAGHKAILVEKTTLAAGTSSRSSKLIHGGLRYLENGHLGLVMESLRERTLLLRNAPELVRLETFRIPIYAETRRPPWVIASGLSLYALLCGFRSGTRFGRVPVGDWRDLDGLRTDGLKTVFRYHDARTDDRALTRAVMRSAIELGAELACPCEFVGAEIGSDGVEAQLRKPSGEDNVFARVLVNAAGPWVNEVADRIRGDIQRPPVALVQGTHIEVPGQLERGCYYIESPRDGRAIFVMSWKGHTLVGTTETRFDGPPDNVHPLASEEHYLVSVLKHYFPDHPVQTRHDVLSSWAGVRVLPKGTGHAFHRTRETRFVVDRRKSPRAAAVYGGKLTTHRATAEKLMSLIASALPERHPRADTRSLKLTPVD